MCQEGKNWRRTTASRGLRYVSGEEAVKRSARKRKRPKSII